jgi:hypothetical protein
VLVEGRQDGRSVVPLANQHMCRELNDLTRRLDHQAGAVDLAKDGIDRPEIAAWNRAF